MGAGKENDAPGSALPSGAVSALPSKAWVLGPRTTTSAAIVYNGRQGTSTEPPLMPTQPSSGPWDLVKG